MVTTDTDLQQFLRQTLLEQDLTALMTSSMDGDRWHLDYTDPDQAGQLKAEIGDPAIIEALELDYLLDTDPR